MTAWAHQFPTRKGAAVSIVVACNSCGKRSNVPDGADGRIARCPKCGTLFEIRHGEDVNDEEVNQLTVEGDRASDSSRPPAPPPFRPHSTPPNAQTPQPSEVASWVEISDPDADGSGAFKWARTSPFMVLFNVLVWSIAFALTGSVVAVANPPGDLLGWPLDVLFIIAVGVVGCMIWQRNRRLPVILRLMKVSTVCWLVSMPLGMLVIFVRVLHDVSKRGGTDSLLSMLSEAVAVSAFCGWFSSVVITPFIFYVPVMTALFVFWFIERESRNAIK